MLTLRTDIPEQSNTEFVLKDLDMADELYEAVAVRIASYHRRLGNLYNRLVKPRMFQSGASPEKSFREHNQSVSRKVPTKLGGTVYCNASRRIRIICIR